MAMVPTLPSIQNEINRLFDALSSRFGEFSGETLSDWAPRVDVIEDADNLRIYADLPGLNREDIQLSVERNTLTITGVRSRWRTPTSSPGTVLSDCTARTKGSSTCPRW